MVYIDIYIGKIEDSTGNSKAGINFTGHTSVLGNRMAKLDDLRSSDNDTEQSSVAAVSNIFARS